MKESFFKQLRNLFLLGAMMLSSVALFAQQGTIKGTVKDGNGDPIIGANIFIESTNQGTVSDSEGNYTLPDVTAGPVELTISFIGYLTEKMLVTVAENGTVENNVVLIEDLEQVSEVVVIGYGTTKKSDLTGAVATVSPKDLQDKPVANLDMALQGKIAGVEVVSNSGSPGAISSIRIRGTGTITNSDPIFVVDGIVMNPDAITFLNTSDIESISLLKDASATAIYGSRGANGVIMITTRQGKKGDIKVNFSTYYGIQQVTNWMDLMDGPSWAATKNLTSTTGDIYDPDTVASTNWLNEISRTAPMFNSNLSFSGGNEKATYYVALGYFDQDGVIQRTNYKRYTLRINSTMDAKSWLSIGESFQVALNTRDYVEEANWYNGAVARAMSADPITPVRDENGEYAPLVDGRGNPVARMEMGLMDQTAKDNRLVGNLFADFKILEGLNFKTTFGGELNFSEYKSYQPAYNFGPGDNIAFPALFQNFGKNIMWQWENYLTYQKVFGIHDLKILAGTSASLFQYYDLRGTNRVGPSNESESLHYFDSFSRDGDILAGTADHAAQYSWLARLNYGLMNKYLVTATIRRDGSSKFGSQNKFGWFPSFAAAWKLSNESFMEGLGFISTFKIHAGWGKTGNDKIGSWSYVGTVTPYLNYAEGQELREGYTTLRPPNEAIKWETTKQTNIGFDAGFLENKLLVNFEYFIRNTEDMLAQIEPPLVSGIPTIQATTANIGKVRNKGFEFTISYRQTVGDFNYEIGGYISRVVNKVIDLGGPDVRISTGTYGQGLTPLSVTMEGMPIASFYGYIVDGIFQNYEEINSHAYQSSFTEPGDFIFKDINGDGKIDAADQTFIGSPFPDFTYGFNLSFAYKAFDILATFQGVQGGNILTPWKSFTHNALSPNVNLHSDLNNAWTPENTSTDIPRIGPTDGNGNIRRLSTYYVEDASYLRFKTAQIGYTLPKGISDKVKIDRARIYIGAQNLFIITKYSGNDPEIGLSQRTNSNYNPASDDGSQLLINVDVGNIPQPRVITFGLDLTF